MILPLLTPEQQAWTDHAHDVLYEGDIDNFLLALELDPCYSLYFEEEMDSYQTGKVWHSDQRLAQLATRVAPDELSRDWSKQELLTLIDEHHHTLPEPDPLYALQHAKHLQSALHDLVTYTEQIQNLFSSLYKGVLAAEYSVDGGAPESGKVILHVNNFDRTVLKALQTALSTGEFKGMNMADITLVRK